jgi:acetyl-CoA carboxylase carboxyltransferase component
MDSGTENLDWTARVLRRIVELTQAGLEINVVVTGINVGAQSYWNAEATMLMHTRGILVMTPEASMVLTGKQALDYSGAVSADDHQGIGGAARIMGPNGQAQYTARDVTHACQILLRYYALTYVAPGERFPRRAGTTDPVTRDITSFLYGDGQRDNDESFATVGDIFAADKNPGKKKPFDIRRVMQAAVDQDRAPLERWSTMRHAEMAVVWDAFVGGIPVALLGIESRRLTRHGFVPGDGPTEWTGGTLFPLSSKKVARAINAASGRRPVVVLANLSGFDGSPESMRKLQLEYGAEIGRAVVTFDGPMVFVVISRYHGGAYVVFSRTLNDHLEVAALEGSYASVIGGAPAAAVVFARELRAQTHADQRVRELRDTIEQASTERKPHLAAQLDELLSRVYNEKLGELASRFDAIHSVERARDVGSLQRILSPRELRPYLVDALERGMARFVAATGA